MKDRKPNIESIAADKRSKIPLRIQERTKDQTQEGQHRGGRLKVGERRKRIAALLLCAVIGLSLTACGGKKAVDGAAHSFTIGSTRIVVEETQMKDLLDAGYSAAVPSRGSNGENTTTTVTGDTQLSADSIYYGIYIVKDSLRQMVVDVVTDSEAIPLSDAKISAVTVYGEDPSASNMTFDGVLLSELTKDKFLELVPESDVTDDGTAATYKDQKYSIACQWNDNGEVEKLQMERTYTAQYSS